MKKLLIIGAGGHGKVAYDIAQLSGEWESIDFLEDQYPSQIEDVTVIDKVSQFRKYIDRYAFFVAIGNNKARKSIQNEIMKSEGKITTLIHPSVIVSNNVSIGIGVLIAAGAVINPNSKIHDGVIINTSSSIDHDTTIKEYAHISPGVHMGGSVFISSGVWIGVGSTVINNVTITRNTIIGAGSVVIDNVLEEGMYVGVPARRIK
jgi:sugar O-acyltransferase (sialic acid O-acetyltransferase NeuD family)